VVAVQCPKRAAISRAGLLARAVGIAANQRFDLAGETGYPAIYSLTDPISITAGRRNEGLHPEGRHNRMARMAKFNPFQFLQEVRSETSKVTFPTRKEVMVTTAMVFVLAIVAAIFFTIADQIIRFLLTTILGVGR
jgi:preprotein translocase subunit SecE